jgi:putative endonuclease
MPHGPAPTETRDHLLYVLECADGSLYTGYTVDLARRLTQHQAGTASKYTRTRRPVALRGYWAFADRTSALQAEYAFKQLTRAKKLSLLASADGPGEAALARSL